MLLTVFFNKASHLLHHDYLLISQCCNTSERLKTKLESKIFTNLTHDFCSLVFRKFFY